MTSNRSNQKASQRLRAVTPGQVEAMRAADESGILAALVAATMAATMGDSDDVREHACLIVASYWSGATWADTERAVRAAVKDARVTVAQCAALDAWAGDFTDMVEERGEYDMGAHSTLSQWGTSPADAIARTTARDVVDHAVASVPGARGVSLSRAVEDMRGHDADECDRCHPGAGRRPSLTGITAHVEAWEGHDSRYHASRRHTVAALASVDREAVLAGMGGTPLADRPRKSSATGGDRTPRTEAPVPVLTVTAPDGTVSVRGVTDAESVALATAGKRAPLIRHAGEEYGVSTAGPRESDRAETTGMLRSFKPVVSPRKRGGSNTGPTVPARLSH